MESSPKTLAIDARPAGVLGAWGAQAVNGRPVLAHHVAMAGAAGCQGVSVHVGFDEIARLTAIAESAATPALSLRVTTEPIQRGLAVVRTDRLYAPRAFQTALKAGRSTETAVVWRLDTPRDLEDGGAELLRRTSYQPLGAYWAWKPAQALAARLRETWVRPNHVTIACAGCMLGAALVIALWAPAWPANVVAALLMAVALVLDTADGHLARVQGTASKFGRWLDAVLDEAADVALHAGVGWALFRSTAQPAWLLLAIGYVAAKFLFSVACQNAPTRSGPCQATPGAIPGKTAMAVRFLAHADVRWHLWIGLAGLGWLGFELAAYTVYYGTRAVLVGIRGMGT